MNHDHLCEMADPLVRKCGTCGDFIPIGSPHCHCGSRAFPLCVGCRDGRHLQHRDVNPSTGKACSCDLCADEGVAA